MASRSKIYAGSVGWSYEDWIGPFYPKKMQPKEFLKFYSKKFPIVEIDSTFYSLPNSFLVNRWKINTPEDFRFTVKVPQAITHEKKLRNVTIDLDAFHSLVSLLGSKLACILLQMPPSFKYDLDYLALEEFLRDGTGSSFRYAVEFRDRSWFRNETFDLLERYNICFAWSVNQYVGETPPIVTTDFIYLRFIGDRKLTRFDKIQKDQSETLARWANIVKEKSKDVINAYALSNNHFAGYAPWTIDRFNALMNTIV